jgi:transmembrane sensor
MQLIRDTGIREEAARWYARLHAHDCTEGDRAAFRCWQGRHRRHREAYETLETVTKRIDAVAADARLQALAEEAFEAARAELPRATQRWHVPAALAASVLFAVTCLYIAVSPNDSPEAIAFEASNELASITLSDGSEVQLDVNTKITAAIGPDRREIKLLRGRAMFAVAHDRTRPFSVDAAGARTTALGTRFQVQRSEGAVLVTLEEGSVAIESTSPEAKFYEQLHPGEQLSFDAHSAAHEKRFIDLQEVTGWTRGRLVFRGTPLEEALREVNRYSGVKVRLGDPTIASVPVGGNFHLGNAESVVSALVAALPLRAVRNGEHEILLFHRYETDVSSAQL